MVVSLTPIIPATSAAANSSVSRVVPLPFSMPSHRFPLLAASAAAQCTGHVYLRLRLLANTLLYLTLIYFILPYCVQGNLAPRRTWRKKGVAYMTTRATTDNIGAPPVRTDETRKSTETKSA